MNTLTLTTDILIIGSGAAGLGVALSLADSASVTLISKDNLQAGSSQYAQGGIAAAVGIDDSVAAHVQDTLNAGAGLCDPAVATFTATHAKTAVEWLMQRGVQFDLHLTQEGGHSHRRILHASDKTGAVVVKTLCEQVFAHANIQCKTEHMVIDLIMTEYHQARRCVGAVVYDEKNKKIFTIYAKFTVLATGGASYLYLHTSNRDRTTGDGIAMAYRAGCRVANLEFNQFHPTCLYHPKAPRFLITEVMRGEGGYLLLPDGKRFMQQYDSRAEMAPRDIVVRAIDIEMKKHRLDCVYLDISHRPAEFIRRMFPTIYAQCLQYHMDITKDRIPVVPAAHYTCGGVMTDINGQTDIAQLYAVGEVAHTGLHGANRMASNSLLECLVFAASSAKAILAHLHNTPLTLPANAYHAYHPDHPDHQNRNKNILRKPEINQLIALIRHIVWEQVGIVRNNKNLLEARDQLNNIAQKINTAFSERALCKEFLELRNMITVASLIVESALSRKESRGVHYNSDYPEMNKNASNTILQLNPDQNLISSVTVANHEIIDYPAIITV